MRISGPSANSAAAMLLLLAGAALAGDQAPSSLGSEGQKAVERLRQARSKADPAPTDIEVIPRRRDKDGVMDQRAFDGLRRRILAPDMDRRARAAQAAGDAALAAERERQGAALRQALGLEPVPQGAQGVADRQKPNTAGWVPVMFVSSSMPLPVLRAYARQLAPVHGVMALRGFPGGMKRVGPMAKLTAAILRLDEGCEGPACAMQDTQIIVDPILFRQHGVARVPALAMVPGDPTQAYCERDDDAPRAAHLVYGDSALAGLLDEYARLGGKEEVRDAQALSHIR